MRLAVFTPLPPLRSGIADYSASLLPEMARHAEVEAFVDDGVDAGEFAARTGIRVRPWREYRPEEFDRTLYQFGNNPQHVYIRDLAARHPGVALLHEFNLHHLAAAATILRGDWDAYMAEVAVEGDEAAMRHAERARRLEVGPDYDALPLNRRVLDAAEAVIVHSDHMLARVRAVRPALPVARIPHGAWIPQVDRNRYRHQLGLDETVPLIGVFGFLKPYKRIRESLEAFRRLIRVEPRARMILVGEEHPEFPVRRLIADFGLADHARVLGYTPIDEFVQYIGACDICLNLRYPTAGETSGTLLRALGLGRAVVVSDLGAFADLPDEICLKVPPGAGEVDLLFEYLNLLVTRPEVRRALGERARRHVAVECSWEAVGRRFVEALADLDGPAWRAPAAAATGEPAPNAAPEVPLDRAADASAEEASPPEAEAEAPAPGRFEDAIRSWVFDRASDAAYVETHLTRLARTLELIPPGAAGDAALEMGAYLHITPLVARRLGYGEVRGCYLGPVGKIDARTVRSREGDSFSCAIDHFDAERDIYPYPDGRFALVLCCELIEHLYEDPMHMMAEINRVLRPGGHLLLSTPNACSLRAISATLLSYHPGLFHHYVVPDAEGKRDPRHAREYAPRDVQALFEAAGFAVERLETGPYLARPSREYDWVRDLLRRYELPQDWREDSIFCLGRKTGPVRERYPAALYAGGAA